MIFSIFSAESWDISSQLCLFEINRNKINSLVGVQSWTQKNGQNVYLVINGLKIVCPRCLFYPYDFRLLCTVQYVNSAVVRTPRVPLKLHLWYNNFLKWQCEWLGRPKQTWWIMLSSLNEATAPLQYDLFVFAENYYLYSTVTRTAVNPLRNSVQVQLTK